MSLAAIHEPVRWDPEAFTAKIAEARALSKALEGPSEVELLIATIGERIANDNDVDLRRHITLAEAYSLLDGIPLSRLNDLLWDWRKWARPKQIAPRGEWLIWLILSGRGFGKSRAAAEWVRERVDSGEGKVIGIVGPTHGDIHKFMLGGHLSKDGSLAGKARNASGLIDVFPPHQRPDVDVNKGLVWFHTGAVGFISTAEEPELRGANFDTIWCDELAKWRYLDEIWYNIEMTARQPPSPRIMITTTPRNLSILRAIVADQDTYVTLGTTRENGSNLDGKWLAKQYRVLGGTRTGTQELEGEILGDNPDALYNQTTIDATRCSGLPPKFAAIAIGVDPAISVRRRSDLTGIGAMGISADRQLYPLHDVTGADFDRAKTGLVYWHPEEPKKHLPNDWGDLVCRLYYHLKVTYPGVKITVVGERNRGGDLVRAQVVNSDRLSGGGGAIPCCDPETRDSKENFHEPLAAAYENGLVHHVGHLPRLETEMCEWNPRQPGPSPNRCDAMRIAATFLCPEMWRDDGPPAAEMFRGLAEAQKVFSAPTFAPHAEETSEEQWQQTWDRV